MSDLHNIDASQATLFFQEINTSYSPTILWLHGFCEDHQIFTALIHSMQVNARHILPDLPGYGKSKPKENFDFSMESFAQCVLEMLNVLNIQQVHCIGHSMGGYICLELAKKYPSLIHSLTLFHSTASADSAQKKENRNRTIDIVKKDLNLFLREFHQNLFYDKNKIRFQSTIEQIRKNAASFLTADTVINTLKGLRDRNDSTDFLKHRTFPLNYIIGRYDPILPANEIIEQAKQLKASYTVLEDSGHMGFIEEQENVIKLLKYFIISL
ncbi:MAG: alpha/beta hydrolase [Flavobacteriales bacterium]|nr:alpha/beta hydrolase [Flavobacteriales bacterium]